MTETMPPENDAPKLSVNFDLTDIEDIDGISDGIEAEPSSDDDTFISYKKKKPTKRRYKDAVHSRIEKESESNGIDQSSGSDVQVSEDLSVKKNEKESEVSLAEKSKTNTKDSSPQMCPPTDHFNELEKRMNGPGWKITSSSASCSEDELGANERDEFTFKMCQIIKRSHRYKKNKTQRHQKKESNYENMLISTTVTELTKSENESGTEDEKQELKFCCGNVPLVALREDDL